MIDALFRDLGMTPDHATIYSTLLTGGPMQVSALQTKLPKLKRPTLYKYLHELAGQGYVRERKRGKVIVFEPVAPSIFLKKAEEDVREAQQRQSRITEAIGDLQMRYLLATEKPSMQFYDGIDGIKEIYDDHLRSKKDMFFVRTNRAEAYRDFFGEWWGEYLKKRAKSGMKSHGITPDDPHAFHDQKIDKKLGIVRSWVNPEDYTASVEVNMFGEKTAIISYGKELFGLVIEHKEITQALKDLFKLAEKGASLLDIRHDHS